MENKKLIYLCKSRYDELNEMEKKAGVISYKTLVNYYDMTPILCNNIIDIDECLTDNIEVGSLSYIDEDGEEIYKDIYQYYIVNLNNWDIENLKKYDDEIIIAYSEKIDNYILLVDHFGTLWSGVLTDIEFTTDYEVYQEWEKSIKKGDE